jgi:hypothetical protein
MNKLLLAAIASILPLAACTTAPMASAPMNTASSSPAGERYCWKRNLSESNGKLYCNWVTDRDHACERGDSTPVDMARFSGPMPSGRCEDGNYLVKVMPRAAG